MKKLKARGLRALIPVRPKTRTKRKKENVYYVEIKKIRQTPEQVKKEIDRRTIKDLIDSVKKYGVIQPLILVKIEKKKKGGINVYYQLVSGQKRLLAAKQVGLKVVPAVIKANDKV